MEKSHDSAAPDGATDDLRAQLDRLRAQCLETASMVAAAAELASPLGASPAVEKLQVLLGAAEKSADAALAGVQALTARLDEHLEGVTCRA